MASTPNAGFFIQSEAGEKGNFEVVMPWPDGGLAHFTRENDARDFPWNRPVLFGSVQYVSACLLQTDWQSTEGKQFNLEVIATTADGALHEFWRDNGPAFAWNGPGVPPFGAAGWTGNASLCQLGFPIEEGRANLSAQHPPFHLIAIQDVSATRQTDGGFQYWERTHVSAGDRVWSFADEVKTGELTGASVVFTAIDNDDAEHRNERVAIHGNGDVVVAATNVAGDLMLYRMQASAHFDGPHIFGTDILASQVTPGVFRGRPAIIQSDFDYEYGSWPWNAQHYGNIELVVSLRAGGIAHFTKDNGSFRFAGNLSHLNDPSNGWNPPKLFAVQWNYDELSMIQSNFGAENLYVVARRNGEDGFDLYWQDDDFNWQGPTHVAGKRPRVFARPRGTVQALVPYSDHVDVYVTTVNDGLVVTTFYEKPGGWREWRALSSAADGFFGGDVEPFQPFDGHVDIFATSTDGAVMTSFFKDGAGWSDWFRIGATKLAPGTSVSALQRSTGRVELFADRADGVVVTSVFDDAAWSEWSPVDTMSTQPGTAVTASQPFTGHVDLYTVRADGAVVTTFSQDGPWQPWFAIGTIRLTPGSTVTALQSSFAGHVDLYATRADGAVLTVFFDDGTWHDWFEVGASRMNPDAPVTASQPFDGHVDLYATAADGSVMTTYYEDGTWNEWFPIGATKMAPGTPVTAVTGVSGHVDLFATTSDGTVMTTFFELAGGWREWFAFP